MKQETLQENLCNPCGKNCSSSFCNNLKCAIGCADSKFTNRTFDPKNVRNDMISNTERIYLEHKNTTVLDYLSEVISKEQEDSFLLRLTAASLKHRVAKNLDFSQCHPVWKRNSIDIVSVGRKKEKIYYGVACLAVFFNFLIVGWNISVFLRTKIHETNIHKLFPIWDSKSKFSSSTKVFFLLASLLASLIDSITDAMYYVRVKTVHTVIHVPTFVHVIQGILLYTGTLNFHTI